MKISARGLDLIKGFEDFRGELYNDAAGHATIGYGHLVHRGAVGTDPATEAPFRDGINEESARLLLLQDTGRFAIALEQLIVPAALHRMHATTFDACVSFAFNLGVDAVRTSKMLALLNDGDEIGAAEQFPRWCHAGSPPVKMRGLLRRRYAEAAMFLDY